MRNSLANDIKEVNSRLLHDKYNNIIFKSKKDIDIYLVGGYIRDIFINREGLDRDFVVRGRYRDFLNRIASSLQGRVISIGKKNLSRIILKNGTYFDFTTLRENIENDLSERDFTINALAWSPEGGLIDYHNGLQDLSWKIIRMVNEKNLKADPIRILRAYRFAAELSFTLDTETRQALKRLNNKIQKTKSERITLEFCKILSFKYPEAILGIMMEDGVLQRIISLSYNKLQLKLKELNKLYKIFDKLHLRYKLNLEEIFSQNLSFKGLLRAEILLRGCPSNRLKLSSKSIKRINRVDSIKSPAESGKDIKAGELYDIFKKTDNAALDYLIINDMADYTIEMERYNEIRKNGLLTAEDIIKSTGIKKGVLLGRAIDVIKRAEFEGIIKSRREARRYIKEKIS